MKRPRPKFRVGQLVHVDDNIDYVWKRRYIARGSKAQRELAGNTQPGWWYKMRYPEDCEEFHEACLTPIRPEEIVGPTCDVGYVERCPCGCGGVMA